MNEVEVNNLVEDAIAYFWWTSWRDTASVQLTASPDAGTGVEQNHTRITDAMGLTDECSKIRGLNGSRVRRFAGTFGSWGNFVGPGHKP